MKKTPSFAVSIPAILLLLSCLLWTLAPPRLAAAQGGASYEGDFYIISSVNLRTNEVFLKAPTEITEQMLVNGKTTFLSQQGKRITLKDLRAGDTVYVMSTKSAGGELVASRIQIGPMTTAILHRRYLR